MNNETRELRCKVELAGRTRPDSLPAGSYGVLMTYGQRLPVDRPGGVRRRRAVLGRMRGIILNEQHARTQAPILRFTPTVDGREGQNQHGCSLTHKEGATRRRMIRNGTMTGLSVEFRAP